MKEDEFAREMHHQVKRKFKRRKVIGTGIDEIWAMDIAFMESFAADNNGFKYILCIIDVFSKYAWCVPLKSKTGTIVLTAVKDVIAESGRQPEKIWVDRGSEFYNKEFMDWAKKKNITVYSTYGESKSVVVERFIRTLKELITRKFTSTNLRNWVKILPGILKFYNNKYHKTIKMTPTEATDPMNEVEVHNNIHKIKDREKKKKKPKFKVGDQVRVSRVKGTFEKGYDTNWTYEVFTISKVLDTEPVTYQLTDYDDELIDGSFYENELLKTNVPDQYGILKILETRGTGNKKEYLVKFYRWMGKYI